MGGGTVKPGGGIFVFGRAKRIVGGPAIPGGGSNGLKL